MSRSTISQNVSKGEFKKKDKLDDCLHTIQYKKKDYYLLSNKKQNKIMNNSFISFF